MHKDSASRCPTWTSTAERLFRHKVLSLLKKKGLLTEERIEILDSWRHSGFSVHNAVTVQPEDPLPTADEVRGTYPRLRET